MFCKMAMQVNVFEWLKNTADRYPDKVALVDSKEKVTYSEYYNKAIAIAREIARKSDGKQQPIVIYMEKVLKY